MFKTKLDKRMKNILAQVGVRGYDLPLERRFTN